MKKFVRWFATVAVLLGAWAVFLFDIYPLHLHGTSQLALQFAPLLALVAFGVYSLVRILYNLAVFPTCPEALDEMKKEMKEAEADLKKRGFAFPNKKKD